MRIIKIISSISFLSLLMLCSGLAKAQDIQFTQFYAAPLYLNPAFTGANVCSRAAANYRNQWPGIKKAYTSYSFAFDHSLPKVNSGVGFLFTNDVAGSGNLRTTTFNGLYSYEAWLTRKVALRAGLKAGGAVASIDFYKLTFGDQIARRNAPVTVEVPPNRSKFYFDISTGILLYTKYFWVGSAFDHVTKPNQSLISGNS